jgi:hypothetical protein
VDIAPAKDGLVLKAARPLVATIVAPGRVAGALVRIRADGVTLEGFKLRARGGTSGCVRTSTLVLIAADGVTVQHNDLATTAGRTYGPCGYRVGIGTAADVSDPVIFDNTLWDWRERGIHLDGSGIILQNRLRFVHDDGADCATVDGPGPLPYCAQASAIVVDGCCAHVVSVVLNEVRLPDRIVTVGARLGTGIDVFCTAESFVQQNVVRWTATNVDATDNADLLVKANDLSRGRIGITVSGIPATGCGGASAVVEDNVSTGHSKWDCREVPGAVVTWTDNVGAKASPPEICD